MDGFIGFVAVILIVAYIVFAIWFIFRQTSKKASLGASAAVLAGGGVIIPLAIMVATVVCWIVVIGIILAIIGSMSG